MSILPDLPATCEHGFPVGHNCRYCAFAPREPVLPPGVPRTYAEAEMERLAAQRGWICAGCGHSYAPWVPECHHCPQPPAFIAKGSDPGPVETG